MNNECRMELTNGKRITYKRARPNPIFEEWLEKLYSEAKTKKSKLEAMLGEALSSISKYPLPLKTGAECAILNGFDRRLCIFLDKRLEWLNDQNTANGCLGNHSQSLSSSGTSTQRKRQQPKVYKPAFKSGGYAILISLYEYENNYPNKPALTKDKIIELAQPHSEESFTRKKPETFYTAWSSMSNLVSKGLVKRVQSNKVVFSLTVEGKTLAAQLLTEYSSRRSTNHYIFKAPSNSLLLNSPEKSSAVNAGSDNVIIEPFPSTSSNGICVPTSTSNNIVSEPDTSTASNIISESVPSTSNNIINEPDTLTANNIISEPDTSTANNIISEPIPSTSKDNYIVEHVEDLLESIVAEAILPKSPKLKEHDMENISYIDFPAGSYEVILLIDKHEVGGGAKKNDPTVAQFNKYPDLKYDFRSLKVGDFTWIARHKTNKDQELVLPYVVERKRMDDLGHSIMDGRFHEQKFRLRKCNLNNVFYLVENYGSNKNVGLPIQSLMQAIANTRVQDKFHVHLTDSLTNTTRFLAMMTKRITIKYQYKSLKGYHGEPKNGTLMTFGYFNKASSKTKTLTVTETFIKLLLQLKGMSVNKALAITGVYKTPLSLFRKYNTCSVKEGEMLLSNLKFGDLSRNVGPSVSKAVFNLFTK